MHQILKAFIMRKATFFANDEWVKKPFQQYRAAPMQVVLGIAARIPGILEKIDIPMENSLESAIESSRKRIAGCWRWSLASKGGTDPF